MTRLPVAVEIQQAVAADAAPVAAHLRAADLAECLAAGVEDIERAIVEGVENSPMCWTAWVDDRPAAVFGVRPWGAVGVPWMLGTDDVIAQRRAFIKLAPAYIATMMQAYPRLMNHVHTDNVQAVRWLRRAGFALQSPHAHPATGAPFQVFEMEAVNV